MVKLNVKLRLQTNRGLYTGEYSQDDYGTERRLVITAPDGSVAGTMDPFWPNGIPASPKKRQDRLVVCAKSIVRQHAYNVFTNIPA